MSDCSTINEEVQVKVRTEDGAIHHTWCRNPIVGRRIEILREDLAENGDLITEFGTIVSIDATGMTGHMR